MLETKQPTYSTALNFLTRQYNQNNQISNDESMQSNHHSWRQVDQSVQKQCNIRGIPEYLYAHDCWCDDTCYL